jgi:hypothetical protein
MQIIHNFDISPREYHERGTLNNFPIIDICPCCSYPKRLTKHGFYWRYAVFFHQYFRIPILRFRCLSCDKTFSILPDFLLPYFQHSLEFVLECLREYFLKCTSKDLPSAATVLPEKVLKKFKPDKCFLPR